MVSLASYLVADSDRELQGGRRRWPGRRGHLRPGRARDAAGVSTPVAGDLRALLDEWTRGFVALNTIEQTLSELIEARATGTIERVAIGARAPTTRSPCSSPATSSSTAPAQVAAARPPAPRRRARRARRNTKRFRLEHALVITFLYWQHVRLRRVLQVLQEPGQPALQVHPRGPPDVYDGDVTHVTGFVTISPRSSRRCRRSSTGRGCASTSPGLPTSMDRFIDRMREESHGELVGDLDDHPDPARPVSRPQRHEPAVAPVGARRSARDRPRCSCSATRRSARRTSSRSPWASSARSSSPGSSPTATCR